MTTENRQRLVRYTIAADLAIVATGVALLDPSSPLALLGVYLVAVAIAAWKSGWRGAALTIMLSAMALLLLFPAAFDESHLIGFIAASAIVTAIVEAIAPRHRILSTTTKSPAPEFGKLFAVEPPADPEDRMRSSMERQQMARQLERAGAAQLEEQREAARSAADDAKVTPITPKPGNRGSSKRG